MFDELRARHFPCPLTPDVVAVAVEAPTFWRALAAIPQADEPFTPLEQLGNYAPPAERAAHAQPLRAVAAATHHEHLLLMQGERCVGWSQGMLRDPDTFFMAYSRVVRSQQRRGLYTALLHALLPYLGALGYERVTSNHMVTNRAVLIAKLKAGFVISGMVLDERYGAQVSLTYLCHTDRRTGFARAYSVEDYPGIPEYLH